MSDLPDIAGVIILRFGTVYRKGLKSEGHLIIDDRNLVQSFLKRKQERLIQVEHIMAQRVREGFIYTFGNGIGFIPILVYAALAADIAPGNRKVDVLGFKVRAAAINLNVNHQVLDTLSRHPIGHAEVIASGLRDLNLKGL